MCRAGYKSQRADWCASSKGLAGVRSTVLHTMQEYVYIYIYIYVCAFVVVKTMVAFNQPSASKPKPPGPAIQSFNAIDTPMKCQMTSFYSPVQYAQNPFTGVAAS